MANSFVLNHNEVAEIEKALEENNLEFNDIVDICKVNRQFVLDYYNNYDQNDPEDKQTIQSFLNFGCRIDTNRDEIILSGTMDVEIVPSREADFALCRHRERIEFSVDADYDEDLEIYIEPNTLGNAIFKAKHDLHISYDEAVQYTAYFYSLFNVK